MNDQVVEDFGWHTAQETCSDSYVTPKIKAILLSLGAKRVVDLGAGNGSLCAHVARMNIEVVGVDYDQKGVELARQAHPDIPFYRFGLQDDPQYLLRKEKAFDVAVSTEVVEHLFSPHLLPIYASAVLKDGGYLVVSTPYHGYLKNLGLSLLNKWDEHHTPLWHGGHIKFWSRKTLAKLLEQHGFRSVSFFGVGRLPFLWKSMILVVQKT